MKRDFNFEEEKMLVETLDFDLNDLVNGVRGAIGGIEGAVNTGINVARDVTSQVASSAYLLAGIAPMDQEVKELESERAKLASARLSADIQFQGSPRSTLAMFKNLDKPSATNEYNRLLALGNGAINEAKIADKMIQAAEDTARAIDGSIRKSGVLDGGLLARFRNEKFSALNRSQNARQMLVSFNNQVRDAFQAQSALGVTGTIRGLKEVGIGTAKEGFKKILESSKSVGEGVTGTAALLKYLPWFVGGALVLWAVGVGKHGTGITQLAERALTRRRR